MPLRDGLADQGPAAPLIDGESARDDDQRQDDDTAEEAPRAHERAVRGGPRSATSRANGRCSVGDTKAFETRDLQSEIIVGSWFQRMTTLLARFIGRPLMLAICLILAALSFWAFFRGGDTLINGTNLAINVLTLMFLPILQATQNRDGAALQAKLDELIKANQGARNDFIGLEQRDEEEIEELRLAPETVTDPHPEEEPVG